MVVRPDPKVAQVPGHGEFQTECVTGLQFMLETAMSMHMAPLLKLPNTNMLFNMFLAEGMKESLGEMEPKGIEDNVLMKILAETKVLKDTVDVWHSHLLDISLDGSEKAISVPLWLLFFLPQLLSLVSETWAAEQSVKKLESSPNQFGLYHRAVKDTEGFGQAP